MYIPVRIAVRNDDSDDDDAYTDGLLVLAIAAEAALSLFIYS